MSISDEDPTLPSTPTTPPHIPPGKPSWARRAWRFFSSVVVALLGRWEPPTWLRMLARAVAWPFRKLAGFLDARPMLGWGLVMAVFLAGAGGWQGWLWWQNRPRPRTVTISVTAPGPMPMRDGAVPDPLVLTFADSAAPVGAVEKTVEAITMAPAHKGTWTWTDDRTLTFTAAEEWPVGTRFNVRLGRDVVAPHVLLETDALEFSTAAFNVRMGRVEHFQDPVNPAIKRAVATLSFSHPVDPAELQKRIGMVLVEKQPGMRPETSRVLQFRVSYDRFRGEASIQSEPIGIPALEGRVELKVEAGVRAARGGPAFQQVLDGNLHVPGMHTFFRVEGLDATFVRNQRGDPEQVLVLNLTDGVAESAVRKHVEAWVLPEDMPATAGQAAQKKYGWSSPEEVGPHVLKAARALALEAIPAEKEVNPLHSWRFRADPGRHLYVRLRKGLSSVGGYVLGEDHAAVLQVPAFPRELAILHDGNILMLSGEHALSVMTRGLDGLEMDVARILPAELNHLVTQTEGDLRNRSWRSWSFNESNIGEQFTETRDLSMTDRGKTQYTALELGKYLGNPARHGLFWVRVRPWSPPNAQPAERKPAAVEEETVEEGGEGGGGEGEGGAPYDGEGEGEGYEGEGEGDGDRVSEQQRLLLVTDLGVVAKDNADGSHDVFVMSFKTGDPVAGATVQVLGKNGQPVLVRTTDASGRAQVPSLQSYVRERSPVAYVVSRGDDLSFLPLNEGGRRVDLSRFDVGGVHTGGKGGALDAYVFSDRGIYRPGDTIRAAMIVKSVDWQRDTDGLPLYAVVTDARGVEVEQRLVRMPAGGFVEFEYRTRETSPTGNWTVALHVARDEQRGVLLGSVEVRVEEFQPDRMKLKAAFAGTRRAGWLSPADLAVDVDLQNLFGAPAQHHEVRSRMALSPAYPSFARYPDHVFHDPARVRTAEVNDLPELQTGEDGKARIDLDLGALDAAMWRVRVAVEGMELEGGRSVKTEVSAYVSPLERIVGYKADGSLVFIPRGSARSVQFLAVNPALEAVAVNGLVAELVQEQHVSVLTQVHGLYRYQSVRREVAVSSGKLDLATGGTAYKLPTANPGEFILRIKDDKDTVVSVVRFGVAGEANLARSLERNAELQVRVGPEGNVEAGKPLQVSIVAPYTGAGLITVERDRVLAHTWFKAKSNASVQTVNVPRDAEGTAYVHVTYVRAPDSPEVFTSPLSSGVVPVSLSRERRTVLVQLDAPALVQPGEEMKVNVRPSRASRVVVWGVDEGILQVARYATPDPLAHFFRKRALEVRTEQILDLLLPEHSVSSKAARMGGDGAEELGANLNPFKRRRDAPVVFWSGVLDVPTTGTDVTWKVPAYFNGSVRVMAVAVAADGVGAATRSTLARSDFVMNPNVPVVLAPGDEAEVSVPVTNMLEGSGAGARPVMTVKPSEHLEVLDGSTRELELPEGAERAVKFRVKAKRQLGGAELVFTTTLGKARSTYAATLSVRPPTPYRVVTHAGHFTSTSADVPVERAMYDAMHASTVTTSVLPVAMAQGLGRYLQHYEHACTEQVVSQAFAAMALSRRPELGISTVVADELVARAFSILRARQDDSGGFGTWAATGTPGDMQSTWAAHFLVEARLRGRDVPQALYASALAWVRTRAARESNSVHDARVRAHAIYVLSRAGEVHGSLLASLRAEVDRAKGWAWKKDSTAAFMAAAYQLNQLVADAQGRAAELALVDDVPADPAVFHDRHVRNGQVLYLLALHFPDQLPRITGDQVAGYAGEVTRGNPHSLSAAWAVLALDAYANAAGNADGATVDALALFKDDRGVDVALSTGAVSTGSFPMDARALRLRSASPQAVFYSTTQAGFDVDVPRKPITEGMEVTRELRRNGKPVTEVELGEEVDVVLSVRALKQAAHDVALVDLLPAGFEVVVDAARSGAQRILVGGSSWSPEHADVREDRVVFYGTVPTDVRTVVYRVKATNRGTFGLPAPHAEAMYDRARHAQGAGGSIVVK